MKTTRPRAQPIRSAMSGRLKSVVANNILIRPTVISERGLPCPRTMLASPFHWRPDCQRGAGTVNCKFVPAPECIGIVTNSPLWWGIGSGTMVYQGLAPLGDGRTRFATFSSFYLLDTPRHIHGRLWLLFPRSTRNLTCLTQTCNDRGALQNL